MFDKNGWINILVKKSTTNLDGCGLVNHKRFTIFTKRSPHQTFLLYGNTFMECCGVWKEAVSIVQ